MTENNNSSYGCFPKSGLSLSLCFGPFVYSFVRSILAEAHSWSLPFNSLKSLEEVSSHCKLRTLYKDPITMLLYDRHGNPSPCWREGISDRCVNLRAKPHCVIQWDTVYVSLCWGAPVEWNELGQYYIPPIWRGIPASQERCFNSGNKKTAIYTDLEMLGPSSVLTMFFERTVDLLWNVWPWPSF